MPVYVVQKVVYLTYILHFLIVILFFMKKVAIAFFNFSALSIGLSGEQK